MGSPLFDDSREASAWITSQSTVLLRESGRARELRDVTVYISDIADFSTFSQDIAPTELVAAMNEYLSAMTDIIEAHGGFVDKYIGDSIVAVFGAPLDDPDHAAKAVRAALRCAARLPELDFESRFLKSVPLQPCRAGLEKRGAQHTTGTADRAKMRS